MHLSYLTIYIFWILKLHVKNESSYTQINYFYFIYLFLCLHNKINDVACIYLGYWEKPVMNHIHHWSMLKIKHLHKLNLLIAVLSPQTTKYMKLVSCDKELNLTELCSETSLWLKWAALWNNGSHGMVQTAFFPPLFTLSGLKDSLFLLQVEESQGLEELLSPL